MSAPDRELPPPSDPLGQALYLLQLTGTLYCQAELASPWGIDLPPMEGCMMLHVVTGGRCWLQAGAGEPRLLETGAVVLLPHGTGHTLRSDPGTPVEPLFDIPVERISERCELMRHGGGGALTRTLCVVLRFEHAVASRLVALLPAVLGTDDRDEEEQGWLRSALGLLMREARALRPGGETVMTRLADVLVIQLIRSWIESSSGATEGWLAALRDRQVGRAIASMHREPGRAWTVASLAREAGMSRSAFSARFTGLVGEPAMTYLARWRMQLAHGRLRGSREAVGLIGEHLGYRSEAAFCRAFHRHFGVPPGQVRRQGPGGSPGRGPDPDGLAELGRGAAFRGPGCRACNSSPLRTEVH